MRILHSYKNPSCNCVAKKRTFHCLKHCMKGKIWRKVDKFIIMQLLWKTFCGITLSSTGKQLPNELIAQHTQLYRNNRSISFQMGPGSQPSMLVQCGKTLTNWLIDLFIFILLSRKSGGGAVRWTNPDSLRSCLCFRVFQLNFLQTSLICCLPDSTKQRYSS